MRVCMRAKRRRVSALWALAHVTTLLLLLLTCCHSNSTGEPRFPSNLGSSSSAALLCIHAH